MPLLPSTTDDPLFDNMLPGDIFRYSRASKEAHAAASSYLRRRFRIESVLGKYFEVEEIRQFRGLQYATGMLVSGSTVVQFFDRTEFPDSDLDCYVEHRYRRKVVEWLLAIGYEYVERPIWPAMPGDDEENETLDEILERVPDENDFAAAFLGPQVPRGYFGAAILLNFEKKDPIRKIQVITCHYAPLQMILNFHSTCVMNVITHDRAYSIFPRATFDERKSMINMPSSRYGSRRHARRDVALAKYIERGWEMVREASPEESVDPKFSFAYGSRRLGDSRCWTIPILPKLDLPERCMETSSWALLYSRKLQPIITFNVFFWERMIVSHLFVDELLRRYIENVVTEIDDRLQKDSSKTDAEMDMEVRTKVNRYLDLFYSSISTLADVETEEEIENAYEERVKKHPQIFST